VLWTWNGRGTSPPPAAVPTQETQATTQTPPAETKPPAKPPEKPPEKPAEKLTEATPPPTAPAKDPALERLELLRTSAQDLIRSGRRTRALDAIKEGLGIAPQDALLQSLLDGLLRDAQAVSSRARQTAESADAARRAPTTYTEALSLEGAATRSSEIGDKDSAVRSFWRAADRFKQAELQAGEQLARERLANEQADAKRRADEQARLKQPEPPGRTKPGETTARSETPRPREEPPPTPPPEPKPVSRSEEVSRVKEVMKRLEAAYDTLDAAAVRTVYPTVPGDITRMFRQFQSYDLRIADQQVELSPDAMSATVVCMATHSYKPRVGSPEKNTFKQIFTLRKQQGAWVIVQMVRL
jgi:hypothetical protein